LLHPDATNPNDPVDFSQILNVSAAVVTTQPIGDDIVVLDDAPTIHTSGTASTLTVDETDLTTNASADFSPNFSKDFGTDGEGTTGYVLGVVDGAASGLMDTATGQSVVLHLVGGVVQGVTAVGNDLVFTVSVENTGKVTLDQIRAVVHPDATNPNDSKTLAAADSITLTATITDKDGDPASATLDIGQSMVFLDDGPSIVTTGIAPVVTVDETHLNTSSSQDFSPNFAPLYGADGKGSLTFDLSLGANATNLIDTLTGEAVTASKVGAQIQGRDSDGDLVFTVDVDATGKVTLDQLRAVTHANASDPNDADTLASAGNIILTATATDKDGDSATASINIGQDLVILDDGPTLTVPSSAPTAATAIHLGNQAGQTATGAFGYDIGSDSHLAAFYAAGGSDFVDVNAAEAGVQISLSGTVNGPPVSAITNTDVTLTGETATTADFNWSFHYDKDPITAGVQDAIATGTLHFDKVADTFTIGDTTAVQGFSFDVIHTSELVSKEPTSNVGHPNIVDETLVTPDATGHNGFVVQFTGNNSPFSFSANGEGSTADHTFNGASHDMVTSANETWVSATQSTNGVAGDTIQKGEALTLRFFDHSPGIVTEATTPSAVASGIAVKFDGIGNSENLIVNLDLIDFGADGKAGGTGLNADTTITRSIVVDNADIYKASTPGGVPSPYNSEFSLDNNDGLVIIESNDYNGTGEHYQIQGLQIMQSSNDLIGTGVNLNKAIGAAGGSPVGGTQQSWGATDNDVLKITDIGFIQTTSGTQTANLDFAFNIHDADLDLLGVQHINALLSTSFIV
jgi:hypothetical protein